MLKLDAQNKQYHTDLRADFIAMQRITICNDFSSTRVLKRQNSVVMFHHIYQGCQTHLVHFDPSGQWKEV